MNARRIAGPLLVTLATAALVAALMTAKARAQQTGVLSIADDWDFWTDPQVLAPIELTDRVGIGTAQPSASLEVHGTMRVLGPGSDVLLDTVYQAQSDGFVTVFDVRSNLGGVVDIHLFSDAIDPPSTLRGRQRIVRTQSEPPNNVGSFTVPIRKGDYWEVSTAGSSGTWNASAVWIPLGL